MNILQRGLCLIHLLIYKFFMSFYWVSAPFLMNSGQDPINLQFWRKGVQHSLKAK